MSERQKAAQQEKAESILAFCLLPKENLHWRCPGTRDPPLLGNNKSPSETSQNDPKRGAIISYNTLKSKDSCEPSNIL